MRREKEVYLEQSLMQHHSIDSIEIPIVEGESALIILRKLVVRKLPEIHVVEAHALVMRLPF